MNPITANATRLDFMRPRACRGLIAHGLVCADRGPLLANGYTGTFAAGKIHQIIAPNGAGKTSLLMCLAGLLNPDSGRVDVQGADAVAWLPPTDDFRIPVRVMDVVIAGRWRFHYGKPAAADVEVATQCLESLGIADLSERPVHELSSGQKRRVNLARVIAQDADVLILDEPFNALDDHARQLVAQVLLRVESSGRTIVIASPSNITCV